MQLTNYQPAPSGLSFDFDTGPTLPRRAYLISTSGSAAVVTVQGLGTWAVEILYSPNGSEFRLLALKTTPGSWRYSTRGIAALAVRVADYTSGALTGMLSHGSIIPVTDVSQLFGAFLIFSYHATPTEPPIGTQIRFNAVDLTQVTAVWISNTTTDGTDQYLALRRMPHGGTLLVQDRTDHTKAVLFRMLRPLLDKGNYIELEVAYQESIGTLVAGPVVTAIFQPGPIVTLAPLGAVVASRQHPVPVQYELTEGFDEPEGVEEPRDG